MKKVIKWFSIITGSAFALLIVIGLFAGEEYSEENSLSSTETEILNEITSTKGEKIETALEETPVSESKDDIKLDTNMEKESITKPEGEEDIMNAALEYADFNVYGDAADSGIGNIAEYFVVYGREENVHIFYYDPEYDESKEAVVQTQRDICLGTSKKEVIKAYGKGIEGTVSSDDALFENWDSAAAEKLLRESCLTFLKYEGEEIGTITFYLDEADEVSCIEYEVFEDYGMCKPLTDEEIKAMCGLYESETNTLEIGIDSGNMYIRLIIGGEDEYYFPQISIENNRVIGQKPVLYDDICLYGCDKDYNEIIVTVGLNDDMWIIDPYADGFGCYERSK